MIPSKQLRAFTAMIESTTNAFTPILIVNLVVIFFSVVVFQMYRHPWIFIPALAILLFTLGMYLYFAIKKEWMLSHKTVQERGMMINAHLMGDSKNVIDIEKLESMKIIPNPVTDSSKELLQTSRPRKEADEK